ncbi:reverse transcriptase domain, reverse transcriptase zinc-binding domain protein [Tanacetum coccineum]
MLVIKRFSERKKVFRERKKTKKICAKRRGGDEKLWCKVIRSVHGIDGALGRGTGISSRGGGVWYDIIKVGRILEEIGIEFTSSLVKKVGNEVEGEWRWIWDWRRDPRGRGEGERVELLNCLTNIIVSPTCRDTWKWKLSDDGDFTSKELTAIIQDQSARKGRLSVRVELDKRGIDLNIILCPRCDDQIETVDHGLVLCKEAMKLWEKIYIRWGFGMVDKFSAKDILQHPGFSSMSKSSKMLWSVVIWVTSYFIWRNRNM